MPLPHRHVLHITWLATVFSSGLCAQEPGFDVHDLLAMERVSGTVASPDGRSVAFVLRTTDLEANRGRTDLWSAELASGTVRRLTTDPASDFEPTWSTDGDRLLFLSTRTGSSQVWSLPLGGGEASQITDLPLGVANLQLSPDGHTLAFTVEVFPDCPTLQCTASRLSEREESGRSGVVYDSLFVRHWDTWKDGRRSHLFTRPLAGATDQEPRDLMPGWNADSPSKPFGGREEITFSPDGSHLVFTARRAEREEPWSTNHDLFAVPVNGAEPPRNLTADNLAWDTHPVFSPDGSALAYLAMERPGYESDRFRIVVRPWPDGAPRVLTGAWDRSVGSFLFAQQDSLLATAADVGHTNLFSVSLGNTAGTDTAGKGAQVEQIAGEGTIRGVVQAGSSIVFERSNLRMPTELFVLEPTTGNVRQLTHFNTERVAATTMGDWEQFSFPGWNDEEVHGFVIRPADFDPERRYPVAFLIHGGPQGSFSNNFHYRWNPQTYAGAGYAVVMVDFHGSVGYGQEFTDSIGGDWGGKPLEDLQKGLAAALERYSYLDGERVCALGASYGGYMINWIAGNWPERFRCLVNHDGLFDHRSMYYTTEELWFVEWDHRGPYFDNPKQHESTNPANFVDRWQTPMLVIHGGLDFRVPETQGIAAFTALQRRGVPSRLLYFPDENHWVLQPENSIQWHDEVLAWLQRWLTP